MEEYTWNTSVSYLREDSCYFFRIDEKTLFWQNAKIGFIYSLERVVFSTRFFIQPFQV